MKKKGYSLGGFADGLERTAGAFATGRKLGEAAAKRRNKPAVKEAAKKPEEPKPTQDPNAYRRGGRVATRRK